MPTLRTIPSAVLFATLVLGCADDLRPEGGADAGNRVPEEDAGIQKRITSTSSGGVTKSSVNATSVEDWIYLDFGSGEEVYPSAPDESDTWDIAYRRYHMRLNGGVSGNQDVAALALPGQNFSELSTVPQGDFSTDQEDGDDEGDEPDYYFASEAGTWYDYNPMTHVLTPKEQVYVIRSAEGTHYKYAIETYYSEAGTAGHLTVSWAALEDNADARRESARADSPQRPRSERNNKASKAP